MEAIVYKTWDETLKANEYSIIRKGEESEGRPVFEGDLKECRAFVKARTEEEWGVY